MFRNYVLTAWRNIIKNGMFSFINIFGLAIGLMSCILIMLFVREESGFDKWLPNTDRLVRLHTAFHVPGRPPFETVRSAGRMMEALRDYAKNEIEEGVRLITFNTTLQKDDDAFRESVIMADGSFFDIFQLPFVHGDQGASFAKPFDLIVTEEFALRHFGQTDVVGETVTVCCVGDEPSTFPITGVIADLPDATHLSVNMLVYLQPAVFADSPNMLDTWTSLNVYTYFKMRDGVAVPQLQERIDYWMNNESPFVEMFKNDFADMVENGKQISDVAIQRVMPVLDLHLKARQHAGSMGDMTPMGDIRMIYTFTVVAALILLIACINFMNLSTARASQRAREVAMRKVLGASRTQVAVQFLGEAVALVMISLLFALVAVEAALPFYNEILGRELELRLFEDSTLLLSILVVSVLVGVAAGLYPAMYLSRFMPAKILKSSKSSESGVSSKLRSSLVIFQFAMSISLVISTAVVYGQTLFANSVDVGYVSEDKLVLNIQAAGDNLQSLKQELENLPEITSVAFSSESPTQDRENNTQFKLLEKQADGAGEQSVLLSYYNMDYGFFEDYQIDPLAGRVFDDSFGSDQVVAAEEGKVGTASAIINETAMRKFGFTDPQNAVGKTLESNVSRAGMQHLTIIGVIPDIHFRSIKFGVRPSVYMLNPERFRVANLTFRTSDVPALMGKVEAIWKNNVPMEPIRLQFLSEMMAAQYADELAQAQLFTAFAILAICVACLGLYGLATFTAERRTKEIGIRKVMGAKVRDIVSLLIWQFSKPVLFANLIAWPLSVYLMAKWLETFPYRIDLLWLLPICLLAGFGALCIAWLTVGGNAARVAQSNPIKALRYE